LQISDDTTQKKLQQDNLNDSDGSMSNVYGGGGNLFDRAAYDRCLNNEKENFKLLFNKVRVRLKAKFLLAMYVFFTHECFFAVTSRSNRNSGSETWLLTTRSLEHLRAAFQQVFSRRHVFKLFYSGASFGVYNSEAGS
jgi:hypothetical protein